METGTTKEEGKVETENRTQSDINGSIPLSEEQKKEQERTRINKELFLQHFPECRGVVTRTCAVVGIKTTSTIYDWIDKDPQFAEAMKAQHAHLKQQIRDALLDKIFIEKDGPSIRYWLDRKDPEYMPKSKTESVLTGDKTLEDIIADAETELNKKEDAKTNNTNQERQDSTGTEIPTGIAVQDTEQTGTNIPIQAEQGTGVLLEKEDSQKSNSESETKGHIENYRRRPAPRVHSERH